MTPDDAGSPARDRQQARLAASLRENLKRRKAQQRSRAVDSVVGQGPQAVPEAHPESSGDDATR